MLWQWLTIAGLSISPALIAGRSTAILAGLTFDLPVAPLLTVVILSSFVGELLLMWLAGLSTRIGWLGRTLARWHEPRVVAWCERWGRWFGLLLGTAVVGPIPIIIALKWMKVPSRRILLPLALSCVLYTFLYYILLIFFWGQMETLGII